MEAKFSTLYSPRGKLSLFLSEIFRPRIRAAEARTSTRE